VPEMVIMEKHVFLVFFLCLSSFITLGIWWFQSELYCRYILVSKGAISHKTRVTSRCEFSNIFLDIFLYCPLKESHTHAALHEPHLPPSAWDVPTTWDTPLLSPVTSPLLKLQLRLWACFKLYKASITNQEKKIVSNKLRNQVWERGSYCIRTVRYLLLVQVCWKLDMQGIYGERQDIRKNIQYDSGHSRCDTVEGDSDGILERISLIAGKMVWSHQWAFLEPKPPICLLHVVHQHPACSAIGWSQPVKLRAQGKHQGSEEVVEDEACTRRSEQLHHKKHIPL
jgi:hypothetical protein